MTTKAPDFDNYLKQMHEAMQSIKKEDIALLAELIIHTRDAGGVVYVFCNGDSANNAEHFVADLSKGTIVIGSDGKPKQKRIRMHSLNENIPLMTAWANDASYDAIFKEQLENLLNKNDLVIGISTSGNSPNVLRAIEYAKSMGVTTVALSAMGGGKLMALAKHNIVANTNNVEIAEDVHWVIGHLLKIHLIRKFNGEI
ncbi:SIS domain-containing protein [Candidatus Micrarchaeota archaeon]|nr:SIS domain-containing protein [Candidatus Micrarchaeota archaeon]